MSDVLDFRKQLVELWEQADDRHSIFLVLSGTSAAKPVQHFYATDGLTALPLFQGTQYAGWQDVMPFLAQVTDTSAFLDWVENTDSTDWGWGLVSNASLDEVFKHIRSLTKITLPQNKEVFLRYWDAKYFAAILESIDEKMRADLMGPISAAVMPNGDTVNHPGSPSAASPTPDFPWFSLPEDALKKIAALCWGQLVDNTLSALGKRKPSAIVRYPEPVARQKVERQLRRLTERQTVTELSPEHVQTIHHALMHEASRGVY